MIRVEDGMKLRRLTKYIGFFGFEQGQVYTFTKHPLVPNTFVTTDGCNSRMIKTEVSEVDWQVIPQHSDTPQEPTSIIIVVGSEQGNMGYGVFYEESKAVSYICEKDRVDVFRFYENGDTESLIPKFINGKIRLVQHEEETE